MKTRELLSLSLILLLSVDMLHADSATWNLNPDGGDWNTATNWTPATVPNGLGDTAFFGLSNTTSVAYPGPTELDGIIFNPGASAFTISSEWQELTIIGVGITNNSGINQNFVTTGRINFMGNAKAGTLTVFTNNYGGAETQFFSYSTADNATLINNAFGSTIFFENSTAGNGTFTNKGSNSFKIPDGVTDFRDNSSAGNGNFTNNDGNGLSDFEVNLPHGPGPGGATTFHDNSTAADGTFINNTGVPNVITGGRTAFYDTSNAGNGIFISYGSGYTDFLDDSNGGTARIKGFGGFSIYYHNAPGMTIGSVEGNGSVSLGTNRLRVGSNNLSTTYSGVIQSGPAFYDTGGSLEKIGSGTLTLSGTNTYTDGTLISSGTLEVTQDGGLGTGGVMVTAAGATLRLQSGSANNYIADIATFSIVSGSTVDLNFDGTPDTVHALVVDGVVQQPGLYGSAASGAPHQLLEFTGSGKILATTTTTPTPIPVAHPTNLSTRLLVGAGNDVGIGGFIVTGNGPRHLLLRGVGPSLGAIIANALPDPSLELHGPAGFQTLTNNNWRDTQEAEIIGTGRPPGNVFESAIVADLAPGAYTAIMAGDAGTTGVGLLEIYDLSTNQESRLTNISTRANVGTGNNIVIAGFVIGGGTGEDQIIVRGLGPSLSETGVSALADPRLELRDSQGALITSDDNWMDDPNQAATIQAAGLAPSNGLESAIAATFMPGAYTVLLTGLNDGTGVGLVEVYDQGPP